MLSAMKRRVSWSGSVDLFQRQTSPESPTLKRQTTDDSDTFKRQITPGTMKMLDGSFSFGQRRAPWKPRVPVEANIDWVEVEREKEASRQEESRQAVARLSAPRVITHGFVDCHANQNAEDPASARSSSDQDAAEEACTTPPGQTTKPLTLSPTKTLSSLQKVPSRLQMRRSSESAAQMQSLTVNCMHGACPIDALTELPVDLFDELMRAGKRTRARGQHRQIKGCGGSHLVLTASRSSPGLHQDRRDTKERAIDSKRLDKLSSANASAASLHARAVGEKARLGSKEMLPIPNHPRRINKDDITMAGSAHKAVTLLKQKRAGSVPAPRCSVQIPV